MAASNYFAYQIFVATCKKKQNISVHGAVLDMAGDPFWDMSSTGILPPYSKTSVQQHDFQPADRWPGPPLHVDLIL